jgi:hypothetical protein
MKKHLLFIAFSLCLTVAFAEMQRPDEKTVVKTEFVTSDALAVSVMNLGYIAEAVPYEKVPEFIVPNVAGKIQAGYEAEVFHPPVKNSPYIVAYSKRH